MYRKGIGKVYSKTAQHTAVTGGNFPNRIFYLSLLLADPGSRIHSKSMHGYS